MTRARHAARRLQSPGADETDTGRHLMGRRETAFLAGFGKAAMLAQQVKAHPPSHTTAEEYMRDVAHLHEDSEDLLSRGLAVGCLSAFGQD